jgi:hypothetical protein
LNRDDVDDALLSEGERAEFAADTLRRTTPLAQQLKVCCVCVMIFVIFCVDQIGKCVSNC